MNISLISRSFQPNIQGIGSYSKVLYESVKNQNNININTISQDNSLIKPNNYLDYLFFSLIELRFKIKDSDVYHAISPLESLYLNPNKSVVTILDLIPIKLYENSSKLQTKLTKKFFDRAMNKAIKCEKIIAISEETAKDIEEYYNIDYNNINVIRPAIKPGFYPKNLENEVFTVGTVSHLNDRKRVDILIKSFLKADIEDSQLLIGGKGPELEKLKKISNEDPRIKFLGFIPDTNMVDFYNSLDVFVFPTIMEGYGLPIVEAMACGKPVITLEDGLIPEDIKNKTFISSISNLANDLKEKNFECDIKSNINFVNEHSLEKMGKSMMEIYKSI